MQRLKDLGLSILGILILIAAIWLFFTLFFGGVWLAVKIYPWAELAAVIAFLLSLLVFLPMLIFRKSRPWGALALFASSYLFGFVAWVFSFILTLQTLGLGWLVVGLLFAGVGVVPLALIGTASQGLWSPFWQVVIVFALTFGTRIAAVNVLEKPPPDDTHNL